MTVGVYLEEGRIHPCHGQHDKFCVGYLSYAKYKKQGGLEAMPIASIGIQWGLIDTAAIDDIDTFDTVSEMLADHQERSEEIDVMEGIFGKKSQSNVTDLT
jgi:hypothetical protein